MKRSLFSHPHIVPTLYDFLSFVEHEGSYFVLVVTQPEIPTGV